MQPIKLKLYRKDLGTSLYKITVFHGNCSSSLVAMATLNLPLTYNGKMENLQFIAMSLQIWILTKLSTEMFLE